MKGPKGFTLLEVLVMVATVALLLSLTLPMLARSRDQARQTADTAVVRNSATVTLVYANDFKEAFPFFGTSPFDIVKWWYECLLYTGHIQTRQQIDPLCKDPPEWTITRFQFTMCTSINARFMQRGDPLVSHDRNFESQRLGSVAFPSQKGMIVRGWTGRNIFDDSPDASALVDMGSFWGMTPCPLAAFDGSATLRRRAQLLGGNPEIVRNSIGRPFYSTWGGLGGIDW
jgi:hypothetical protein